MLCINNNINKDRPIQVCCFYVYLQTSMLFLCISAGKYVVSMYICRQVCCFYVYLHLYMYVVSMYIYIHVCCFYVSVPTVSKRQMDIKTRTTYEREYVDPVPVNPRPPRTPYGMALQSRLDSADDLGNISISL